MNVTYDSDGTAVIEISKGKDDEWEPAEDGYSLSELKKLWLGFAGDTDEVQKLSGFAQCSPAQAKRLIQDFKATSRTKRLAEADAQRKLANDTTTTEAPPESPEKPQKRKSKKVPEAEEEAEEIPVPGEFVPDAIIAAAVAQKHGLSVVEAEGRNKHGSKVVLIENVSVDGIGYHRVKVVEYQYFRSFNSALATAKKQRVKIKTTL